MRLCVIQKVTALRLEKAGFWGYAFRKSQKSLTGDRFEKNAKRGYSILPKKREQAEVSGKVMAVVDFFAEKSVTFAAPGNYDSGCLTRVKSPKRELRKKVYNSRSAASKNHSVRKLATFAKYKIDFSSRKNYSLCWYRIET